MFPLCGDSYSQRVAECGGLASSSSVSGPEHHSSPLYGCFFSRTQRRLLRITSSRGRDTQISTWYTAFLYQLSVENNTRAAYVSYQMQPHRTANLMSENGHVHELMPHFIQQGAEEDGTFAVTVQRKDSRGRGGGRLTTETPYERADHLFPVNVPLSNTNKVIFGGKYVSKPWLLPETICK